MGSPDIDKVSGLTPYQEFIEMLIGERLSGVARRDFRTPQLHRRLRRGLFEAEQETRPALRELLRGTPVDSRRLATQMFRTFDREAVPRIEEQFARHGASFSSRRGETVGRAAADVTADLGALQTGLIESARNRQLQAVAIPLQQALGQIGGVSTLSGLRLQQEAFPFQVGLPFLSRQSQAIVAGPSPLQQVFQGAGLLFGASGGFGLGQGSAGIFGEGGIFNPSGRG